MNLGGLRKAKLVEFDLRLKRLRLGLKTAQGEPLLEGELAGQVDLDESYWEIEDDRGGCRRIVVHLVKKDRSKAWNGLWSTTKSASK